MQNNGCDVINNFFLKLQREKTFGLCMLSVSNKTSRISYITKDKNLKDVWKPMIEIHFSDNCKTAKIYDFHVDESKYHLNFIGDKTYFCNNQIASLDFTLDFNGTQEIVSCTPINKPTTLPNGTFNSLEDFLEKYFEHNKQALLELQKKPDTEMTQAVIANVLSYSEPL